MSVAPRAIPRRRPPTSHSGAAVSVARPGRPALRAPLVCVRQQPRDLVAGRRHNRQRPPRHPLQRRHRADIERVAQRHLDPAVLLTQRQHAVGAGQSFGDGLHRALFGLHAAQIQEGDVGILAQEPHEVVLVHVAQPLERRAQLLPGHLLGPQRVGELCLRDHAPLQQALPQSLPRRHVTRLQPEKNGPSPERRPAPPGPDARRPRPLTAGGTPGVGVSPVIKPKDKPERPKLQSREGDGRFAPRRLSPRRSSTCRVGCALRRHRSPRSRRERGARAENFLFV